MAWKEEKILSAVIRVGVTGRQRGKAVGEIPHPYKPQREQEWTVSSRRSHCCSCVLVTPSFHDSIKWLKGNTANVVFQEFILALMLQQLQHNHFAALWFLSTIKMIPTVNLLSPPEAVCLIIALSLIGKSKCIWDVNSCHTYLWFHACSNTGF